MNIDKFWTSILFGEKYFWQNWEEFNLRFVPFRLSLFQVLGYKAVQMTELFKGAKFSGSFIERKLLVPELSLLSISKDTFKTFPTCNKEVFILYVFDDASDDNNNHYV